MCGIKPRKSEAGSKTEGEEEVDLSWFSICNISLKPLLMSRNLYLLVFNNPMIFLETYDSCVVCTESETKARAIHPDGMSFLNQSGTMTSSGSITINSHHGWANPLHPDQLIVIHLGPANSSVPTGVVCSSYNAK